ELRGGTKSSLIKVINGEIGWSISAGRASDLSRASIAQVRDTLVMEFSLRELSSLVKDRDCKLTPLGESRVDEKPGVRLKVVREGSPELKLYFDKKTGLLLKREAIIRPGSANPRVVSTARPYTLVVLFEDYQETAGLKVHFKTSTFRDGKKTSEKEVLEFK